MDLRWMKTSRPMARLLQQDAKSLSQCLENRALRHPPHRSPSFGGETMAAVSLSFAGVPLPRLRAHPDRARSKPLNGSEEHTSELQSPCNLVCRLLLEKKKKTTEESHYELSARESHATR